MESDSKEKLASKVEEYLWMIRPCTTYKEEFEECTSYRGRFHQNYVHGNELNCSNWKEDYNNCAAFMKTKDPNFALQVIESEKLRRRERIQNAANNNIWEYRTEPPKDWSRPLPNHLDQNKMPRLKDVVQDLADKHCWKGLFDLKFSLVHH